MITRVTFIAAALSALITIPAFAQEPVGCDKFKWPVDRETTALRATDLRTVASGGDFTALPFAAKITLKAPNDAALPTPPERAPKDGTFAGFLSVKSVAPGLYSVSLSAPAWLDVVQNGQFLKAKSFSGVQGCDGIRKVVKFELTAAPFILQVSGVAADSIGVAVMPASD
jgi:hypothetical protein